jgi:SAM-dependent methyltransferase
MGGSLPEMDEWDPLFDETYFRFYGPILDDERARTEAEGAIGLAGVEPGAEVLDCPCGFARHAAVLAGLGYRVTGVDRSEAQLAEARRRLGSPEWPRLVRADYRELPFADGSFDAALNLFTSLGYLDRAGDVGVLRELRRVLRPGGRLVLETMHRDRFAAVYTPRMWEPLPDGSFFLQERIFDQVEGTVGTTYRILGGDDPLERRFVHHLYTPGEWDAMLAEAGFSARRFLGGWNDEPLSVDTRLIAVATA